MVGASLGVGFESVPEQLFIDKERTTENSAQ